MLRATKDDEGCDVECGLCGRHLITGRCFTCGYVRKCDGCDCSSVEVPCELYWNDGPVVLCQPCADRAFELQNDDAKTP